MKIAPKSITALFFFVATVYVMRSGDHSLLSPLTKSNLRNLAYSYARPASKTCDGVSLTASFSQADIDRAKNLQTSLKSNRGGNQFQIMLEKGSVDSDSFMKYLMGLIAGVAVWAAFFVISLILCCCGICNWCCMFGCCKNCKCCRCCKVPQGTKRKRVYMIVSLLFMVGLFSAGIAGAVYSGNVSKGMKVAYCNAFNFVEDFAYGYKDANWLGLAGISSSLFDLLDQFNNIAGTLNTITGPDSTKYNTLVTSLDTIYTNQNAYTVTRVDPAVGGTYSPDFFANLGPKETSSTYVGAIYTEVKAKYDAMNTAITKMNDALGEISGSKIPDIQNALSSGRSTANDIFKSLDNTISTLDGNGKTLNDVINAVSKAILGIFIAYIIIALLPIASILLIVFLKIKFFSKILHVSWCLMGLLAILGFLVSAIFYPISVVFVETCGVLTSSLTDEAFFNKTLSNALSSISKDASDLSYICMFGNGDALKQLGLTDQIGYFDTINSQIDAVKNIPGITPTGSRIPTATVATTDTYLNSLTDGVAPDSDKVTTDLGTLNGKTNGASCSSTVQDTWVLNHGTCSSGTYTTTFGNSNAATTGLGTTTCIGIDYFGAQSYTGNSRYGPSTPFSGCGAGAETATEAFVTAFTNHRTTINGKVTSLTTGSGDWKSVMDANSAFESDLYSPFDATDHLKTQLQGLQDSLTSPTDGLIANTNCHFIGLDMVKLTTALCYGFVTSIFQSVVVLIVVSMFSFFGSICVFCLAKRILNQEDGGFTKGA